MKTFTLLTWLLIFSSVSIHSAPPKVLELVMGEGLDQIGYTLSEPLPDIEGNLSSLVEGPPAMTVDRLGRLYILDSAQERVKIFSAKGRLLSALMLPQLNNETEHNYTDILVGAKGSILLLDTENQLIARIRHRSKQKPSISFGFLPHKTTENTPLILESFRLSLGSQLLTQNRFDGSVFQILPPQAESRTHGIKKLFDSPPFRPMLQLTQDSKIFGLQFHPKDPSVHEFFAMQTTSSKPRRLFQTKAFKNLHFVELLGLIQNDFIVALFSGAEEQTQLTQLLRLDQNGQEIRTLSLRFKELPWTMHHRYLVQGPYVYISEYTEAGARTLRIHRYKL
jgi:hypothetical protein